MTQGFGLVLMVLLIFLLGYGLYTGLSYAVNLSAARKVLPNVKPNERVFLWYKRQAGLIGVVLLLLIVISLAFLNRGGSPTAVPASGRGVNASPTPEQIAHSVDEREVQRQVAEAKAIQERKFALAKAQQKLFLDTVRKAEDAIRKWEVELRSWDEEVEPLLSNDGGRHIAASPEAVLQFRAVLQEERPGMDELISVREVLETLASPIRASLDNPDDAAAPSDYFTGELNTLLYRATNSHDKLRHLREQVTAIVRRTRSLEPDAAVTLAEAIEKQQERESQEHAALLAERMEAARKSASDKVIRAQEAAIEQTAQSEARRIDQQAERERLAAEQQRLIDLANDKATIADFAPFLQKGRYKLFSNAPQYYDVPQPVSYATLESLKIMTDFERFVAAGCWGCYGPNTLKPGENDRPRWSAPTTEADLKQMRERFALFQKLAPVWKEQGKLAP